MSLVKFSNSAYPNRYNSYYNKDIFNDIFNWGNGQVANAKNSSPSVNIREDEEKFVVEVATPGLKKEDLSISVDNEVLTISSVKEGEEQKGYSRMEFSYQSFSRSFTLPDTVNEEAISASYEHGVLAVSIPKKEEAKPKPKMEVAIS